MLTEETIQTDLQIKMSDFSQNVDVGLFDLLSRSIFFGCA